MIDRWSLPFMALFILGCAGPDALPPQSRLILQLPGGIVMDFIRIPSSQNGHANEAFHEETGRGDFWMQETEVTQAQWKAVMGKLRCGCGAEPEDTSDPRLPMSNLNFNDCGAIIDRLNEKFHDQLRGLAASLPKEAEWEYACRAGTRTKWHCGEDEAKLSDYAWFRGNSGGVLHPVALKKPNPWGLFDMYGNAQEWCSDAYVTPPGRAPERAEGDRSLRGGNASDSPIEMARRWWGDPVCHMSGLAGMRIVLRARSEK